MITAISEYANIGTILVGLLFWHAEIMLPGPSLVVPEITSDMISILKDNKIEITNNVIKLK